MNDNHPIASYRQTHYMKAVSLLRRTKLQTNISIPLVHIVVIASTVVACIGGEAIMGYQASGVAWFIPLVWSLLTLSIRFPRIKFPIVLWVPWTVVVLWYLSVSDFPALQRSVQVLCPIAIGMAASTYKMREEEQRAFLNIIDYLAIALIVIVLFKTGLLLSGQLPEVTGLAPEVMTGITISAIFAAMYSFGRKRYLLWWCIMSAIPIVAVTRTAIVVTGLTLPLTFGPLKFRKRILFLLAVSIIGLALFYSPRVQGKMFYSGRGNISDVLSDDFKTTGRYYMWEYFWNEISKEPWYGYGAGAGEIYTRQITRGQLGYPHNDWLLTIYDYGVFGTSIYVLTLIVAVVDAYRRSRSTSGTTQMLFMAGGAIYLSYAMMMYTDNIMVYASFFGNLHFLILGVAYGSLEKQERRKQAPGKRRITW